MLPARVDESPEVIRRLHVLTEMEAIAQGAANQNALNQYAESAAHDVALAITRLNLPEAAATVHGFFADICLDEESRANLADQLTGQMRISDIARQVVEPDESAPALVDAASIKKDVLAKLHPDKNSNGEVEAEAVEIFQAIVQGQSDGDHRTAQGMYAEAVARRVSIEDEDIKSLELKRYRAWIALQASRGRFSDEESVDVWKDHEMRTMAFRTRVALMGQLAGIFFKTQGADEQTKRLDFSGTWASNLARGVERMQRTLSKVFQEESVERMEDVSIDEFDRQLPEVVNLLAPLVETYKKLDFTFDNFAAMNVCSAMERLGASLLPLPAYYPDADEKGDIYAQLAKTAFSKYNAEY